MQQYSASFAYRRREWLKRALAGGAALPLLLRDVLAAGTQAGGVVQMNGEVLINGRAAALGAPVLPGDHVVTAPGANAVFVVGADAFLLRGNSELLTSGRSNVLISSLRLVTGRLLSVFGRGQRRIATPTATIGIRGTGLYLEVEAERTYACTCYGVADLEASNMPSARETVRTKHHDSPRYIHAHGEMPIKMIEVAPVINHTDAELIMLEALVGRTPPFVGSGMDMKY
ncbi:MAG: hypothetical protein D4R74_00080 [Betaproteobacteria bacterium]|nr:MAG: hypothetical protein D4R74_00080 [Betaproteobacteria bacterium]